MLKLAAIGTALAFGLAVPFHPGAAAHPTKAQVEQKLLHQMNSGPNGRVTRAVHCQTSGGRSTFSCRLQSVRSTSLGAVVVVHGTSLQTAWQPLRG
jgi:hypothetical protein